MLTLEQCRSICRLALLAALCGVATSSAMAQTPSFAANRVIPVSTLIPAPRAAPVSPLLITANNPAVVPMVGSWRFAMTRGRTVDGIFVSEPALRSAFTASDETDGHPVTNVFDGDPDTVWTASPGSNGAAQWVRVDLGKPQTVNGVALDFGYGRGRYRYEVALSGNGQDWQTVGSGSSPVVQAGSKIANVAFQASECRYIRASITGVARSSDTASTRVPPASLAEIGISVLKNGKPNRWTPPVVSGDSDAAFAATAIDPSVHQWHTVSVPSNWELAGYSKPTYNGVDDAVGLYRRWVDVPASFAGKRVFWRFDGVFDGAEIYVNGVKAGYHESGYTAFDVDLTGLLKPGRPNLFALRVSKQTSSVDADTGDFENLGGIYRETFLYATPRSRISDIDVRTDIDHEQQSAKLTASFQLAGAPGQKLRVSCLLYGASGKSTLLGATPIAQIGSDGAARATLTAVVPHPMLWSAEHPNLYTLVCGMTSSAPGGGSVERVQQRIGFRDISVTPNQTLLWNGVPIKCAGVCRHETYPTLGAALTDAIWQKDIALMKSANVNAIRTSHYNHARRFLDYAEASGFYVLDEIPYCWFGDKTADPAFAPALLERARETYARDKNRPEVLAWSCGNENGSGAATQAVVDYMHRVDPTRPAFSSEQNATHVDGQSFLDSHYPKPTDISRLAREGLAEQTPVSVTEQPHTYCRGANITYDPGMHDYWSKALTRSWTAMEQYPNIMGAFIWEWQNQPLVSTWSDSAPNHLGAPVVLFENNKGVVDGWRNPKPELWAVQEVYSPVQVTSLTAQPQNQLWRLPVRNRYSFTNLSALTYRWTPLLGYRSLAAAQTARLSCAPLSETTLTIHAPEAADAVRVEFNRADGSLVYSALVRRAQAPLPQPPGSPFAPSEIRSSETASDLVLATDRSSLSLSKQTGMIDHWMVDGVDRAPSGMSLNLGQGHGPITEWHQDTTRYIMGADQVHLSGATLQSSDLPDGMKVSARSTILVGDDNQPAGTLTVIYDASSTAALTIDWSIAWTGAATNVWDLGMTLGLPGGCGRMAWERDAFLPDYPAGHMGAPTGVCSAQDVRFRSAKRELKWMSLTDASGRGLVLIPAGLPLIGRADLQGDGGVTLYASSAEPCSEELSSSWVPDESVTLSPGSSISGSFKLRPL